EHMYLLDENILRFLTVQLDEKAMKSRQQQQQSALAQPAPEVSAVPAPAATAPAPAPAPASREPLFTDEADEAAPAKQDYPWHDSRGEPDHGRPENARAQQRCHRREPDKRSDFPPYDKRNARGEFFHCI